MARETLKNARQAAGMTQQQIADLLDISLVYYQKIEAGTRTGDFVLWDTLEDITGIHQRKLREISENRHAQEDKKQKKNKNGLTEDEVARLLGNGVEYRTCYDGALIVCSDGKVYRRGGDELYRLAKISPSKSDGYLRVNIVLCGKQRTCLVHRVIAQNFLSNPAKHNVVNHKDGNRANNSVENLEWCSQKENMQHMVNMHKPKYFTTLKKRREEKKISTNQLAHKIGLTIGTYRRIENALKKPTKEEIQKIEAYFGENIEVLLMKFVEEDE